MELVERGARVSPDLYFQFLSGKERRCPATRESLRYRLLVALNAIGLAAALDPYGAPVLFKPWA
jgi:hypothetical protein